MNHAQVENTSALPVKRKSTARTELVSAAAEAKFLDVAGRVDVSRAMGLLRVRRGAVDPYSAIGWVLKYKVFRDSCP